MKVTASALLEKALKNRHSFRLTALAFVLFTLTALNSCTTLSVTRGANIEIGFEQPYWAPYCENPRLVRYYYFPDIECYYDVRHRDFVYMVDGEWMFGRNLPRTYAWFDLDNCFVVALNVNVFEPWRHFNYYVSHYPRYYYRTLYSERYRDHLHPMRGFNENERRVVYKHKPDWDDRHMDRRRDDRDNRVYRKDDKPNGGFQPGKDRNENRPNYNGGNIPGNRNEDKPNVERKDNNNRQEVKQNNEVKRDFPERRVESTKESQPVQYNAKEVGRPVKVQRNMKNLEEIKTRPEKEVKKDKEYRKR